MVLTSFTRKPASVRNRSTRAIASHRHAANARHASSCASATWASVSGAGTRSCGVVGLVLVGVRVELVAGHDLPGHRHRRRVVTQHPELDLAAGDRLLHHDPLVVRERDGRTRRRTSAGRTPSTPRPTSRGWPASRSTGSPSSASTASASASRSWPSRNSTVRAYGSPAAANARFIITLSIATAEPTTPEPTYGRSASSSRPCTVPSSP